eukprot:11154990-Lingulodinium_polyedra.AAC.1
MAARSARPMACEMARESQHRARACCVERPLSPSWKAIQRPCGLTPLSGATRNFASAEREQISSSRWASRTSEV